MAYMSQQMKKELAPAIKAVLKEYGMKGTIAVRHHSTLIVNIKSGALDFSEYMDGRDYLSPNQYHLENNYQGECLEFLQKLVKAMMDGNHDRSDSMTDYFDVGWYIDINIGDYGKAYEYTGPARDPKVAQIADHFPGIQIDEIEEIEITDDATARQFGMQ